MNSKRRNSLRRKWTKSVLRYLHGQRLLPTEQYEQLLLANENDPKISNDEREILDAINRYVKQVRFNAVGDICS